MGKITLLFTLLLLLPNETLGDDLGTRVKGDVVRSPKGAKNFKVGKNHFRLKEGELVVHGDNDLELKKGKLFVFINKKFKRKRPFRLRTEHSSMGIRGTKFFVEAKEDETYLCVCEGAVEMEQKGKKRVVGAGEDLWAKKGKDLGKPHKATKMMFDMSAQGFKDMGFPVAVP